MVSLQVVLVTIRCALVPIRFDCITAPEHLGDNYILNVHLGRYIVGYMVGNFVLQRRVSGALKCNFRRHNWRYTSPNEYFEYGYPHSNALFNIYSSKAQHFAPNWSFVSNVKQLFNQSQATSLMTSVLRRYIAEYTDANSWRYPIRHHVAFASALEFIL